MKQRRYFSSSLFLASLVSGSMIATSTFAEDIAQSNPIQIENMVSNITTLQDKVISNYSVSGWSLDALGTFSPGFNTSRMFRNPGAGDYILETSNNMTGTFYVAASYGWNIYRGIVLKAHSGVDTSIVSDQFTITHKVTSTKEGTTKQELVTNQMVADGTPIFVGLLGDIPLTRKLFLEVGAKFYPSLSKFSGLGANLLFSWPFWNGLRIKGGLIYYAPLSINFEEGYALTFEKGSSETKFRPGKLSIGLFVEIQPGFLA